MGSLEMMTVKTCLTPTNQPSDTPSGSPTFSPSDGPTRSTTTGPTRSPSTLSPSTLEPSRELTILPMISTQNDKTTHFIRFDTCETTLNVKEIEAAVLTAIKDTYPTSVSENSID